MKFPAIVYWNEATQQWRIRSVKQIDGKHPHMFEIDAYDCEFVLKIEERLELSRKKNNLIVIELKPLNPKNDNGPVD